MGISIKNITKLYGNQKALDQVSFSIETGSIVGLLGPNGAGKSTLMKIMTTFIPPSEGTIVIEGFDIREQDMEVKKILGYLPEHNPLYLEMFVREYLEFVAQIYKLPNSKDRVEEIIKITGLELEQHKKLQSLSKGYRQRVGLAQALIHDPQVLILDEPTSGLDPNQLIEIRNLIKEIAKTKTILFSTHIMQEVEAICDRVVILDKGKVVADDLTKNIIKLAEKQEVIIVELDKEILKDTFSVLSNINHIQAINATTWEFFLLKENNFREELFAFTKENQIKIQSIYTKEQSLENVFHQLTI